MQFSMLITGGTVVLFLGLFGAGEGWVLGGLVATVAGVVRLQSQSIEKLNRLRTGISMADVRAVLGEPRHTESVAGRTMLKYELFQWFAGTKPVYIIFGPNGKLAEWYVDEKQYLETQKLWLKAFKELRKAQD